MSNVFGTGSCHSVTQHYQSTPKICEDAIQLPDERVTIELIVDVLLSLDDYKVYQQGDILHKKRWMV